MEAFEKRGELCPHASFAVDAERSALRAGACAPGEAS